MCLLYLTEADETSVISCKISISARQHATPFGLRLSARHPAGGLSASQLVVGGAHFSYESREHPFDLSRSLGEFLVIPGAKVAEVTAKEQVVLEFTRRAHR